MDKDTDMLATVALFALVTGAAISGATGGEILLAAGFGVACWVAYVFMRGR